jgi:primary-amine oxidase
MAPDVQAPAAAHPLDPLSAEEVAAASRLLREQQKLEPSARFVSIALHEPPKADVAEFEPGAPIEREALLVVREREERRTYEAVVSLTREEVVSWEHRPDAQPALTEEDFLAVEEHVKVDPRWQEAMRKRGIEDFELVMLDPWPAGYTGPGDEPERRLNRPLTFVRESEDDNGYARPVEGLIVLFDLDRMEVLEVEDHGVVPVPAAPGNYTVGAVGDPENVPHMEAERPPLKPLEIQQPEGPSFEVDGWQVRWQKWSFRVGFTPREGLVLHELGYEDQGRVRPIVNRASFSEMVVPYGDPAPTHRRKNVFDGGEDGLGVNVNSLTLGCDCLGEIHYFDAVLNDLDGNPVEVPNAICLHEEDFGVLWKHTNFRTEGVEVRRSRRLVISAFMTLANYDYGFYWYLYQDGTIGCEAKLTGIMSMGATTESKPRHGALVAPGLYAPNHQHYFNVRLDMAVDGPRNTVYEVNSEAVPLGEENPYGNAWDVTETPLGRESEAQRQVDPLTGRLWKIVNDSSRNANGGPVGYKLVPGENVRHFFDPSCPALKRAGFIENHLWVTRFSPEERYAAGDFPYQHTGGAGLPAYVAQDRELVDEDVVVWYTMGHHHITRAEDWPVMPVSAMGFELKPTGFFDGNPALDVAPSAACHSAQPD